MATKTWVVINDLQIPFHDKRAVKAVTDFTKELKPDGICLNGDIVDCYSISDYARNPITPKTLGEEIRLAGDLMDEFKNVGEKVWVGGNHEDRLRRYLWNHAPALAVLGDLEFPSLFRLGEKGFKYLPYGGIYKMGKLNVTHGSMVRRHSGQTALAHLDKYGASVMVGHTHRLGVVYRRDLHGVHAGFENGCLCLLTPEYTQHPNWQQGFSVVKVDNKTGFFNVTQIPILPGYQFYYGANLIGGKTNGGAKRG